MDEKVPIPPLEDDEGLPDGPAGDDGSPEDTGEAGPPDDAERPPRRRSSPAPELSIEEQRRKLQDETGEREGPSRKHRPLGDYRHFG